MNALKRQILPKKMIQFNLFTSPDLMPGSANQRLSQFEKVFDLYEVRFCCQSFMGILHWIL